MVEPTKQVILEMLFDDMKDVNEVVEEYNKFKNNEWLEKAIR